jgi:hypothetical protein
LKTFAVTATAIGKIPRGLFNRLYHTDARNPLQRLHSLLPHEDIATDERQGLSVLLDQRDKGRYNTSAFGM